MISYAIISYDMMSCDMIAYDMIAYDMITYGRTVRKKMFLRLSGHVGDMIGYHDWSF